jgi:SAM-dependent methyltransferase
MYYSRALADQSHQSELARWGDQPTSCAIALARDVSSHESLWNELHRFLPKRPQKIWFAGCGLSVGPVLYAALGHNVWASDISLVAIEFQNHRLPIQKAIAGVWATFKAGRLGPGPSLCAFLEAAGKAAKRGAGELHFLEHDFSTPFPEGDFDSILNVRSFQILPGEKLSQVAAVHWEALKPGGHIFFSTINVGQETWRQAIEGALAATGFTVDNYSLPNTPTLPQETKVAHVIYSMG